MDIELRGDRIILTGWSGKRTPDKCRAIGGGRFIPREKSETGEAHWSYPLSMAVCRAARVQFGDDLRIGPALNRWAKRQVAAEKESETLARADDADLRRVPEVAPVMHEAMSNRTYQRVAAAWGAQVGSFLLADQQGLGKTIETLGTIIEAAPRSRSAQWHLILAPSVSIETVWSAEVRRWLAHSNAVALPLTGSLKERQRTLSEFAPEAGTEHVFVIVNIESARVKPVYKPKDEKHRYPIFKAENAVLPALHSRVWDTVVVDECQRALIRTTGKANQTRGGFMLLARNSERRIALSGTPMRGKPEQLWGTLNWLRPDVYTSYWNWAQRYFALTSNGFSNYILNGFLPEGEKHLAADLQQIMLRRTKAEVLPELPPKTYAGTLMEPDDPQSPCGIWLDPSPAQRKQIKQFERDGYLDFGDEGEIMANGVLAEYTRQKQLADAVHELRNGHFVPTLDSPKYQWLLNFLSELDGEPVVVASQFTQIVNAFALGLREEGYKVATLTGETSMPARAKMVEEFQNGTGAQVFILNTRAGGVSLTLDTADYLVLLDETTVPDDQEQVEDRIHRASRIHNVTIYTLRILGTLDEEVAWIAAARLSVQQYLLDGARGVETARALYHQHQQEK